MKNLLASSILILIAFCSFGQLKVEKPEHREVLYDHYDGSLKLLRISDSTHLKYVFHYHDVKKTGTEKVSTLTLGHYTDVRQFLDLCDSTMNTKMDFETELYTIRAFDKSGEVQAWIYMPDGSVFHVTREVYFEIDKALEKKEHVYRKR